MFLSSPCALIFSTLVTSISFPDGQGEAHKLRFICTISPRDGFWRNGCFDFLLHVPLGYPFVPPTVRCITPVFHPNIDANTGDIALALIYQDWKPVLSINTVVFGLQLLFVEPDLDSVKNQDCAMLYRSDKHQFASTVERLIEQSRPELRRCAQSSADPLAHAGMDSPSTIAECIASLTFRASKRPAVEDVVVESARYESKRKSDPPFQRDPSIHGGIAQVSPAIPCNLDVHQSVESFAGLGRKTRRPSHQEHDGSDDRNGKRPRTARIEQQRLRPDTLDPPSSTARSPVTSVAAALSPQRFLQSIHMSANGPSSLQRTVLAVAGFTPEDGRWPSNAALQALPPTPLCHNQDAFGVNGLCCGNQPAAPATSYRCGTTPSPSSNLSVTAMDECSSNSVDDSAGLGLAAVWAPHASFQSQTVFPSATASTSPPLGPLNMFSWHQ